MSNNISTKEHYCYILKNTENDKKIYIGYTTNPSRRIRQHIQEIKGGAKYTKYNKSWVMIMIIKGFPNMNNALQFEWRLKHPENKKKSRYYSIIDTINGLQKVLNLDKWTNNSTIMSKDINLILWILEDYSQYLEINNDNIKINIVKLHTNNIIKYL